MASIIQGATTGLKYLSLTGDVNFNTDDFKIALYTEEADLSPNMEPSTYSTTNEVVGAGYTAGGNEVIPTVSFDFDTNSAYVNFADTSWTSATFTARGAVIYQVGSLEMMAILDFGSNVTVDNNTFNVTFPPDTVTEALIRFE